MEHMYERKFELTDVYNDGYGRLAPHMILYMMQETAGDHCKILGVDAPNLGNMFWAVLRYRVEVTRMPKLGQTITVRTWPMPTTRSCFPRAAEFYDEQGECLIRLVSLWVLMDKDSRQMVLPSKCGIQVPGVLTGTELEIPAGVKARVVTARLTARLVTEYEIDANQHMNNASYISWAVEATPRFYEKEHELRSFTACYFSEAKYDDELALCWTVTDDSVYMDSYRINGDEVDRGDRVFATEMKFERIMKHVM